METDHSTPQDILCQLSGHIYFHRLQGPSSLSSSSFHPYAEQLGQHLDIRHHHISVNWLSDGGFGILRAFASPHVIATAHYAVHGVACTFSQVADPPNEPC